MKKNNLFIFATAILFTLLAFTNNSPSNVQNNPYLIMRVIECQGGDTANESMILIDRGNNEISKIELEKFHKKTFQSNFKIISKTINDIKLEDYTLIATSGGGGNDNAMILQNYIFEKN